MKLENRNLMYSLLLAAVLVLFLVGYFVFMLPSLYLAHRNEENLDSIVKQHKGYIEHKSYEGVKLMNPSACLTVEIPIGGNELWITNAFTRLKVTAKEEGTQEMLDESKQLFEADTLQMDEDMLKRWGDKLAKDWKEVKNLPVDVELAGVNASEFTYREESLEIHRISDNLIVVENNVADAVNRYTTYLAVTKGSDSIILSFLPAMTTGIEEIRVVVMSSLPMTISVIVVLVLFFSYFYSQGIIRPLFSTLEDKNKELHEKNGMLLEENERQEVFLRASSHQLKTPVSAALLLVEGMISKVGKYADYDTYLPKVKEQLLSMRTMIESILYLGRSKDDIQTEKLDMEKILEQMLRQYAVACREEGITVDYIAEETCEIETNPDMLLKVLDNLVSNAVQYSGKGGNVVIRLYRDRLELENTGHIPDAVEAHIFEPFVTGNHKEQSKGLGLYIAAFYARQMRIRISVRNVGNRVVSTLEF